MKFNLLISKKARVDPHNMHDLPSRLYSHLGTLDSTAASLEKSVTDRIEIDIIALVTQTNFIAFCNSKFWQNCVFNIINLLAKEIKRLVIF